VEQFHVRFCFADAPTADAFRERFGGTRLTSSPFKPGRSGGEAGSRRGLGEMTEDQV